MRKSTTLKAIALSLGLAALMAPATMNAQINHGLLQNPYKTESNKNHGMLNSTGNRNNDSQLNGTISGYTIEDPTAPLGSGIAVLVAVGAGYALLKRKEEAK